MNQKNKLLFLFFLLFSQFGLSSVTNYDNGKSIPLDLSYTNPNYIAIDGDIITNVDALDGKLILADTNSGGIIFYLMSDEQFTFFIQTEKGLTIPIEVNAFDTNGTFHEIVSTTIKKNIKQPKWEKNNGYETNLTEIAKAILNHSTDFLAQKPKGVAKFDLKNLTVQPVEMYVGNTLNIVRYEVKNKSAIPESINEKMFKSNYTKAVFFDNGNLKIQPNTTKNVYVIFSMEISND